MALAAAASTGHARAANPAEVFELPALTVIGTTPLPGLGTALKDVPANVQSFGRADFRRQRPLELTDFLERNANSVGVGAAQGNPYQQDLNFRGFTASPLLGTPQGVSVFQDGVRINEAFGDIVNWDLLPASAISSVQLIPGSNPAFGLNTLGGAMAIYTRSGAQSPGGAIELSGGSFGRKTVEFEYGGVREHIDYFLTGNFFDDRGWADHNPSRVKQFFGKVGYQDDKTDFDLSLTLADNALQGTQTLPVSWLDTPRQAYTFPDRNENRLAFVTAKGSRFLGEGILLGGNAYYRRFRNTNVSSNVNDHFGGIDPASGPQLNQAINDRSAIDQKSWGLGLQMTMLRELGGRKNQFIAGISGDFGDTAFAQDSQIANFTPARDTVGSGGFIPEIDVGTTNRYVGVYFSDTLALAEQWTLTLSGRYNRAHVTVTDRSGTSPDLDGNFTFSRFNPAIGINFNPDPALTTYAAYSEGMRAPSPVELTCSDAAAPCKLPNIFLADPPLKKVVSKTVEAGARGKLGPDTQWAIAAYRTDLDDDIQFISSGAGAVNAGYFQNVGKTRRQGVELWGGTRFGALSVNVRYSHTEATFRSTFVAASPNNSTADANGAISVNPGNRIPGIPADSAKLRATYDFGDSVSIGASVVYASSQFARGDENNQDSHGRLPSYAVVDLDARYLATKDLEIFARVANLFDRRYQSVGVLGSNFFTGPNRTFGPALGIDPVAEQFRGVGAPRGIWVGMRYAFDTRKGTD
ncbi:MAG: TonB-dependent receptor [Pseudomonadota bacterium]|nr:TonB-dependent receptor [Pseudomonadota bacterium]